MSNSSSGASAISQASDVAQVATAVSVTCLALVACVAKLKRTSFVCFGKECMSMDVRQHTAQVDPEVAMSVAQTTADIVVMAERGAHAATLNGVRAGSEKKKRGGVATEASSMMAEEDARAFRVGLANHHVITGDRVTVSDTQTSLSDGTKRRKRHRRARRQGAGRLGSSSGVGRTTARASDTSSDTDAAAADDDDDDAKDTKDSTSARMARLVHSDLVRSGTKGS